MAFGKESALPDPSVVLKPDGLLDQDRNRPATLSCRPETGPLQRIQRRQQKAGMAAGDNAHRPWVHPSVNSYDILDLNQAAHSGTLQSVRIVGPELHYQAWYLVYFGGMEDGARGVG